MANYFFSQVGVDSDELIGETSTNIHAGTASTASDKIELRFDQTCTRFQALKFLERAERWLKNGGLNGAGANMGAP